MQPQWSRDNGTLRNNYNRGKWGEGQLLRKPVEAWRLAWGGHMEPVVRARGLGAPERVSKQGNNTDRFSTVSIPFPSDWDHHRPPPSSVQYIGGYQYCPLFHMENWGGEVTGSGQFSSLESQQGLEPRSIWLSDPERSPVLWSLPLPAQTLISQVSTFVVQPDPPVEGQAT